MHVHLIYTLFIPSLIDKKMYNFLQNSINSEFL